ncbi:TIGR01777 family oxidoreductase [Flavobacteriales bacterium]|nr:TIGR01777 family oxidoreductase [Flavobacteriales bacterium]
MKKLIIAGGSGFIGKNISQHFKDKGYSVTVFTRGSSKIREDVQYLCWDAKTLGSWTAELEGADLVINLTGKSVDCRYTEANKKEILNSRVDSTKIIGEAIQTCKTPPKLWINSSTATIYRYSLHKPMTEENGEFGNDFSMNVAKAWEDAFFTSPTPSTRKVALRISLVLGKNEGVLPVLKRLTKLGFGGKHGNGKQKFAWIHIADLISIIDFIETNNDQEGSINCTSPESIDNKHFMQTLRNTVNAPFGIPTPKWMLVIGTFVLRTESELILKNRFVQPKRLLDAGFIFKFDNVKQALHNLIHE